MNKEEGPIRVLIPGSATTAGRLDYQLTELIEFVWACEAAANEADRVDADIKYGKEDSPSDHRN